MTSNYVDSTGLNLQQLADIVTELENGFKAIYGSDINVGANSPDGQMINLFAQAKIDILDCMSQVYNSFSPTSAIGVALDQRCALNGVVRKGATKTTTNVTVTTDREVSLLGLSAGAGTPFTAKDLAGNKFYLTTSATGATGPNSLAFEAALSGATETTPNTITGIETIQLGVLSVNNPSNPTVQGTDEETDAALRVRRASSLSLPSQGYLAGLKGALLALDDVTRCEVYENNTNVFDSDGISPHSIWAVVEGGADADIADVIYKKRNAGCGMYGSETVAIDQGNGFELTVKFGRPSEEDLYIKLSVTSLTDDHAVDDDYLKQYIYDNVVYDINQKADYSAISSAVKIADPLCVIISGGVGSTGAAGDPFLAPPTIDGRWIVATARIAITVV
jgi:uncharacterized phage protein gp47/JayE